MVSRIAPVLAAAGVLVACSGNRPGATTPAEAQGQPAEQASHILNTAALAGQQVSVLPITMVATSAAVASDSAWAPLRDRRTALLWSDSLVADALQRRAPEVNWILPPQLRKIARRAPGMVADPDQMGQAVMRAPKADKAPGALAGSLRSLVAIAGGRLVLIPAAVGLDRGADSLFHADLSMVLLDARANQVVWRTQAQAPGATPAEAVQAAILAALPPEAGQ